MIYAVISVIEVAMLRLPFDLHRVSIVRCLSQVPLQACRRVFRSVALALKKSLICFLDGSVSEKKKNKKKTPKTAKKTLSIGQFLYHHTNLM